MIDVYLSRGQDWYPTVLIAFNYVNGRRVGYTLTSINEKGGGLLNFSYQKYYGQFKDLRVVYE